MGGMGANPGIPGVLHDAAVRYRTALRENPQQEDAALILLEPLGEITPRDLNHLRVGWLCIYATRRVLPAWLRLPCDNMEPIGAINVSMKWLTAGIPPHSWDQVCKPVHPRYMGELLFDCLTPGLSGVAHAAAATARFARTAQLQHAVAALHSVWFATDEGCGPHRADLEFPEWLVSVALPAAYNLRKLRRKELLR